MKYSATWLSNVVHVNLHHRSATSEIVSARNFAARSARSTTGGLRNTRLIAERTRPNPLPTRLASASLRNTAARSRTAPASTARPISAMEMNAALLWPWMTRNTIDSTGSASLMKMFQMPLTPT